MLLALRRQTPWIEFDGVLTHERVRMGVKRLPLESDKEIGMPTDFSRRQGCCL